MSPLTLVAEHDAEVASVDATDGWALGVSLARTDRFFVSPGTVARRGALTGFFHGILFDRADLCRAFGLSAATPNADIVLAAYERDGEGCLRTLRGQFALAVADATADRVLVARDPLGQHPLFFGIVNGTVYFADDTATVIGTCRVPGALNVQALADHLCHRWPYRDETFFQHVRRVPPGWRALVAHGAVRLDRYWDPVPADQPLEWLTEREINQFDEVFGRSVARCFEHDERVGIFLSGGIDSVSVATVAADYTRERKLPPPLALSLGFERSATDERHLQEPIARQLGLPFVFVDFPEAVQNKNVLIAALELTRGLSNPVMSAWQPAYMGLAERGYREGVRTILDGHGGDEWLSISPYLSADLIRRGDFKKWRQLYRVMRRSFPVTGPEALSHAVWTYGLRPLAGAGLDRIAPNWWRKNRASRVRNHDFAWIAPGEDLSRDLQQRAEATIAPSMPTQGFYGDQLQITIDHALLSWDREERYQCGRRVGVDFVHPYMDPDVIALLWRTPPAALNRGDMAKGLVRTKLIKRFPELGFDAQRKLSGTPYYRHILANDVPGAVEAFGEFPTLAALGLIDEEGAKRFVRTTVEARGKNLNRIWDLQHLEAWVRAHGN